MTSSGRDVCLRQMELDLPQRAETDLSHHLGAHNVDCFSVNESGLSLFIIGSLYVYLARTSG